MLKLMKRVFLLLLASAIFISCGPAAPAPTEEPGEPTEGLSFRITWADYSGRGEAVKKIVNAWPAAEATASVTVVGGDEDRDAIEALLRTDDTDVVLALPYRYVQYFGDRGLLADLTDAFEPERGAFYPALWELGTVGDRAFGIPWVGHSVCLLYNADLLAEADVDPASIRDLDSLVAAMEQVEARTDARGVGLVGADHNDISWMVNQFIYGFGGSLVSDDGATATINSPESLAALYFYRDVLGAHAQEEWTDHTGVEAMEAFREQQVAFEFQGVWGVSDIEKNGKPFRTGVIALKEIGLPAEVGPLMLAVPAGMDEERRTAAQDFIRYMVSVPAQEAVMAGEYSPEHDAFYPFRVPARKDLNDTLVYEEYPAYVPFIEGFERPSIDVPVPAWQVVKDERYAPGLHLVMTGALVPEAFLQDMEEFAAAVLEGDKQ